jgi:hypothetical protein
MFNLFQKKGDGIKVIDKIWMSETAKWSGIVEEWRKDPSLIIICWFDHTIQQLQAVFNKETTERATILTARETHTNQVLAKSILFAEHYPLLSKEQETFKGWHLPEVTIHSALDEPLFDHFGSAKIIQMMKQLGMKEDACVEHKMISKAIQNAQEKIGKKVLLDQSAFSQKEWMERNF